MRYHTLLASTAFLATTNALKPQVGLPPSPIEISNKGEISLNQDNRISYANWHSEHRLKGKIRFVQVMGGSLSAKKLNEDFIHKIDQAKQSGQLSDDFYQAITIVDMRKCFFGTESLVRSKLEQFKRKIPEACFVSDTKGVATKEWELESDSSIMAINEKGDVFFIKDGALSEQEGEKLLANITQEIERLRG